MIPGKKRRPLLRTHEQEEFDVWWEVNSKRFGWIDRLTPEEILQALRIAHWRQDIDCSRRLNTDPPCRLNIDPGPVVAF